MKNISAIYFFFLLLITGFWACSPKEGKINGPGRAECTIDGERMKGGFSGNLFEPNQAAFWSYRKDTFTFGLRIPVYSKKKGLYVFDIQCSQKGWPEIGKEYPLRNIQEDEFRLKKRILDKFYNISVEHQIQIYQYADTNKLPKSIRKRKILTYANEMKGGYICFSVLDTMKGKVKADFEVHAEGQSVWFPEIKWSVSAYRGTFEVSALLKRVTPYHKMTTELFY